MGLTIEGGRRVVCDSTVSGKKCGNTYRKDDCINIEELATAAMKDGFRYNRITGLWSCPRCGKIADKRR